jgi:hypothetical protein
MKKILIATVVLFMLAAVVTPAEAATGPRGPFTLVGRITAIDATNGTVTVTVFRGNTLVQPYVGKSLTLTTTAATLYFYKANATAAPTPITFADLKVGQPVSVSGTLANGVWTAKRITVTAGASYRGPFALVGKITAIDATTGVVTVSVLRGNKLAQPYIGLEVALTTTATTVYLYKASATATPTPITFADLKVGDWVSASGSLANGTWTATRITVGAKLSCFP